MVNKCCVPGCQSNYKKKDVEYKYVCFPKKEDLRNEWKRKIPRDNLVVTQNSKVCNTLKNKTYGNTMFPVFKWRS